jgi:hypothetical protein
MNLNHILRKVGRRSSKPVLESADKMFTKAKRFAVYNLRKKLFSKLDYLEK